MSGSKNADKIIQKMSIELGNIVKKYPKRDNPIRINMIISNSFLKLINKEYPNLRNTDIDTITQKEIKKIKERKVKCTESAKKIFSDINNKYKDYENSFSVFGYLFPKDFYFGKALYHYKEVQGCRYFFVTYKIKGMPNTSEDIAHIKALQSLQGLTFLVHFFGYGRDRYLELSDKISSKKSAYVQECNGEFISSNINNQHKNPKEITLAQQNAIISSNFSKKISKAIDDQRSIKSRKIRKALALYYDSVMSKQNDIKYALLVTAIEALVISKRDNSKEIVRKFSERSSVLLENNEKSKKQFLEIYDYRSKILHGDIDTIRWYEEEVWDMGSSYIKYFELQEKFYQILKNYIENDFNFD